jgi:hypothetical protein
MDNIEYVHEHDLPALILGLVWNTLKGSNWRPAMRREDGTLYAPDTGLPVAESAVRQVSLELYDVSLLER